MEKNKRLIQQLLFKTSAPTWNDKFQLPEESCYVSDIQDYFEYIFKKHREKIDNPSTTIYVHKIESKLKMYYLELLRPETMKLLVSTENKITKDKNGENLPYLEITEVVLIHCNIVSNNYQQDSRLLYTFVPNKPFGSLLEIGSANFIFLETFDSEFQEIEVWFTDQNSQPLETGDRIDLSLVIK